VLSQPTEVISNQTLALNLTSDEVDDVTLGSSHRAIKIIIASTLTVLLGLGTGWWFSAGPGGFQVIPNLSSRTQAQATEMLGTIKGKVQVVRENSKTIPAGSVISSEPSAGSIYWGGDVTLIVSAGPRLVTVPDIAGKTLIEATAILLKAGFKVGSVASWFSSAPIGTVFAYTGGDGSNVPEESAIDLEISLGAIPVVAGMDQAAAISLIQLAGLKVKEVTQDFSETVPKGQVISLIPLSDPIGKSGEVNLVVSKGTDVVVMPKVVGETISAAKALLERLGLRVVVDTNQLTSKWGIAKVKKVSVAVGAKLHIGDSVTIISR
jgi:serine/threonine-protein kinase